ncbi:MAG: tetratricopeptide repeat protein, partial [Acidobacteriota bacterium]
YAYARFPKSLGEEQDGFDYVALDRAERFLLDELAKQPTVETQHELGRLYLARKKFDQAETIFQAALQVEPNNASLHADLGAVFFEKWDRQRATGQIGGQSAESDGLKQLSIDHLTKALAQDDSLREARFNLALLYQASNQIQLAREEWDKYLRDDPASPWTEEAKRNLRMLK